MDEGKMTNKEAINILINYIRPPIIRYDSKSMAHLLALEAIGKAVDALEAEPVKHGRWIRKDSKRYYWFECSECGYPPPLDKFKQEWFSGYCPNCGADMREVEE